MGFELPDHLIEMSEIQKEKALENATAIGRLFNSTSAYPKETAQMIADREHRYIQQTIWNMFEALVEANAKNYAIQRYDDRNAYAVKMAAKIAPMLDKFREEIARGI